MSSSQDSEQSGLHRFSDKIQFKTWMLEEGNLGSILFLRVPLFWWVFEGKLKDNNNNLWGPPKETPVLHSKDSNTKDLPLVERVTRSAACLQSTAALCGATPMNIAWPYTLLWSLLCRTDFAAPAGCRFCRLSQGSNMLSSLPTWQQQAMCAFDELSTCTVSCSPAVWDHESLIGRFECLMELPVFVLLCTKGM